MKRISQTRIVQHSPHTGHPILRELNTYYGYYATIRFLTDQEYATYMKDWPEYKGELHEAEIRYRNNLHIC